MRRQRYVWYAIVLMGLTFNLVGCAPFSPLESEFQTNVTKEFAERQQRRERSMKLYSAGHRAYELANLKEARQLFAKAAKEDDRNAVAWIGLGVVDLEREDFYSAARAFDRASTLIPTRFEPHFNLGLVFEAVGQYEKAIGAYARAMELAPDRVEVMENLARLYIKTGQELRRTVELIERALALEQRPEWRDWLKRRLIELQPRTAANVPGGVDSVHDAQVP